MDEPFIITVLVGRKGYAFEARLATVGYTHKFYVTINGIEVIYEPDEERNYSAMLVDINQGHLQDCDTELIIAVGDKIQYIFR